MDDFWENLAQKDPLWAILSDPSKRGRKWRLNEFLETGSREVSLLLHQLRRLDRSPRPGCALDFGCGVGRLTQALGSAFAEAIGADISPTMIRLAEAINANPRVRFVLNQSRSLAFIETGSIDFLYSDIVLQHIEPALTKSYLREFVRVLAPMGVCVFQLPSHKRSGEQIPRQPVRMDPDAYRAGLTILTGNSTSLLPSQTEWYAVDVRNDSHVVWDQQHIGVLRVGNHWREASGAMIIQDDGRTALPDVLRPGEVVHLRVAVQAPDEPGQYWCEFDVVHEGVSWFRDLGSSSEAVGVSVSRRQDSVRRDVQGPLLPAHAPKSSVDIYQLLSEDLSASGSIDFPMHGVPSSEVTELLRAAGADIFYLEEDDRGGAEWCGYRYFIQKRLV